MRLLVVTNMYPTSASPYAGIFIRRQVAALREQRPDWDVEVLHIPTTENTTHYLTGWAYVAQKCMAFSPDLAHVHFGLTLLMTQFLRTPSVVTFHGSDLNVGWKRALSVPLARRCAERVIVSPQLRSRLPEGLSAEVIPCGVDTSRFRQTNRGRSTPVLSGRVVIGFPSSPLRPEKNHGLFERSVGILKRQLDVEVAVLDEVLPEKMPDVLRKMDLLLMTSNNEGSPAVTKEALCCGTRVVSVDVGDMRDQLTGFSGCRLVPSRDPEDIAQAVLRALCDPGPDSQLASERFDTAAEARSLVQVYERCLVR